MEIGAGVQDPPGPVERVAGPSAVAVDILRGASPAPVERVARRVLRAEVVRRTAIILHVKVPDPGRTASVDDRISPSLDRCALEGI